MKEKIIIAEDNAFPKYTTQIINLANQNAQGTRPKNIGQLSDIFPKYREETDTISSDSWREWYISKHPDAADTATRKILAQIEQLKAAINKIDEDMVRKWVENLIFDKTVEGLFVQEKILSEIARKEGKNFRMATKEEESKGIDGYIGDTPYSIKPISYKTMKRLPETIDVTMVYYFKTKNAIKFEIVE